MRGLEKRENAKILITKSPLPLETEYYKFQYQLSQAQSSSSAMLTPCLTEHKRIQMETEVLPHLGAVPNECNNSDRGHKQLFNLLRFTVLRNKSP